MRLIERRIGLLFAVFLALLALAGLRAGWLGVVRADALSKVAATQQKAKVSGPGRARRHHRSQRDRARRLPARDDGGRDALPGQGSGQGRRQARSSAAHARGRAAEAAHASRHRLRLPRPPRARHPRAQGRADEDRGARVHPGAPSHLPARLPRLPAARRRRDRGHGPVGARVLARPAAARPRRRAAAGQGRARRGDRAARDAPREARLPGHAHDRRGDPGQGRAGARGRRRDLAPARRHRDRHGPTHGCAARARQLAARRRQQPRPRPRLRAPEPRGRHDLRAGLDLQALHGRGRARGRQGHAGDEVQPGADDPPLRPRDRRVAPARSGHAEHARDPRPVVQRRRGHDRPEAGRQALRPLGAALRLRQADRHGPPRRGGRDRAAAGQVLRRLDGQPPDRPGPCGDADADGGRLLRDRQRRRAARRRTSSGP